MRTLVILIMLCSVPAYAQDVPEADPSYATRQRLLDPLPSFEPPPPPPPSLDLYPIPGSGGALEGYQGSRQVYCAPMSQGVVTCD